MRLAASRDPSASSSHSAGVAGSDTLAFYAGAGDLGLHGCTASTRLTEPSVTSAPHDSCLSSPQPSDVSEETETVTGLNHL